MKSRAILMSLVLIAALRPMAMRAQKFDDTQRGLPGWDKSGKEAISKLTVVRVDLSLSFLDAVYMFTARDEIDRIASAFAEFERVPEPPPEYDERGNLISHEHGSGMVKPLYQIIVTRERQQTLFYLTAERGSPATTVKITLWTLRPDGMFIPYCARAYEHLAEGDDPPPLKVLATMCPSRPKRELRPQE
ncbi:MAG: hypothetical protein ACUVWX_10530 [Kiritimatiellia bacterium]